MTGRNISRATRQAVYAQSTKEAFIALITLSHPSWTEDIRVSSDPTQLLPDANVRGTISNGDEYLFAPFGFTLPAQDDTGISRATISVENVSRTLMEKIRERSSGGEIDIKIQVVLSSDPDVVDVTVTNFKFTSVNYDAFSINGEISVEYFDNEPFPYQRITPSKYRAVY